MVNYTLKDSTSGKRSTKLATRKVSTVTTNYIDNVANMSIAVASGGIYMFSKGRPKASLKNLNESPLCCPFASYKLQLGKRK